MPLPHLFKMVEIDISSHEGAIFSFLSISGEAVSFTFYLLKDCEAREGRACSFISGLITSTRVGCQLEGAILRRKKGIPASKSSVPSPAVRLCGRNIRLINAAENNSAQ